MNVISYLKNLKGCDYIKIVLENSDECYEGYAADFLCRATDANRIITTKERSIGLSEFIRAEEVYVGGVKIYKIYARG